MSDVPLGAFLSGGVDSALVAAMVTQELGQPLSTFSIGFGGTTETEHEYAREVALHLGTDHHEEILSPDALQLVHEIANRLDEPNGDSSCLPTYLLSRYTREHVTVALSGDGGDELFGGYGRYRDTLLEQGSLLKRLVRSLRSQRGYTPADGYLSPRWLIFQPEQVGALTGGLPAAVAQSLADWRELLNDTSQPLMHRMRTLDAETYMPGAVLPKVDRMSMQVSLEVRCPLLDRDVAEFAQGQRPSTSSSNWRAATCPWSGCGGARWALDCLRAPGRRRPPSIWPETYCCHHRRNSAGSWTRRRSRPWWSAKPCRVASLSTRSGRC